ncbi:MAG TPA: hypothetical protein VM142_12685 [Acidimicrobiales bacterium]|nr:hypothetical protein [Acidimicrobiales bacterium]
MNAERLHAIALAVRGDLQESSAVATMQALRDALRNQVTAPQEPSYQQQVATSLGQLLDALAAAPSNDFPPIWQQAVKEFGIDDLLGQQLASVVREVFSRNQITLAVAQQEIEALTTRLEALAAGVEQLLGGLSFFGVGAEVLEAGEVEVGVLIPRPAVDNELGRLGAELIDLQKLFGPFLELALKQAQVGRHRQ